MANYWYLSSGLGTRASTSGTPYTALQTGTFASLTAANVYGSLYDILLNTGTTYAAGDWIIISDAHSEYLASDTTSIPDVDGNSSYDVWVVVDDGDCASYSPATTNIFTGDASATIRFRGTKVFGLKINMSDGYAAIGTSTTVRVSNNLWDCDLGNAANNTRVLSNNTGTCQWEIVNCTLRGNGDASGSTMFQNIQNNVFADFVNVTAVGIQYLIQSSRTLKTKHSGCDYSNVSTMIYNIGNTTQDVWNLHRFDNCKVKSGVTWLNETIVDNGIRVEAYNCTDSTNLNPNQFYVEDYYGTAESEIGDDFDEVVIRTDGTEMAMEGAGEYMSAKVITNSNVSVLTPFVFEMLSQWSELETAATDTIRIHLTSATTLTDQDVIVTLSYRDGTTVSNINTETSVTNFNPIEAGAELTASDTMWAYGLINQYQIDIPTTNGLNQVPIVTVFIRKAATIYFDTEFELV